MNMTEMIRGRRSVRTFDGTPLREEDAGRILEFAGKVENPYELPIQWKLLDRKSDKLSVPVIEGTDTYIAGKMRREAHAEEAFGYSFEKVVLFAGSLGVGTRPTVGSMMKSSSLTERLTNRWPRKTRGICSWRLKWCAWLLRR